MSAYRLVYKKACYLLVKLQHHTYWALKKFNFNVRQNGSREMQLAEHEEMKNDAYKKGQDLKAVNESLL